MFVSNYASAAALTAIREALKDGQLRIIGAATPEAYAQYISSDSRLNDLFQTIRVGNEIAGTAAEIEQDRNSAAEKFIGDKISSDLRQLMQQSGSSEARVSVILQTDDVR